MSKVKKYRAKGAVVEAMQFAREEDAKEVAAFCQGEVVESGVLGIYVKVSVGPKQFGFTEPVRLGEYVVKTGNEFQVVRESAFTKLYDKE